MLGEDGLLVLVSVIIILSYLKKDWAYSLAKMRKVSFSTQ
jgi:hypothetical protein